MMCLPVEEIQELDGALDIFDPPPTSPDRLLLRGLVPPLPVSGGLLVWGHHLARAAERLGKEHMACVLIQDTDKRSLLLIALSLEARCGRYSWAERERILTSLEHAGKGEDWSEVSVLVEGRNGSDWQEKARMYRGLPDILKTMLGLAEIDLKTARAASDLPNKALDLLRRKGGRLTFSERRMLIGMLREVMERDHLSDHQIAELVSRLLARPEPIREVQKLRSPELDRITQRFEALTSPILRGSAVSVKPPPSFEGDSYSVSFPVGSRRDLDRRLTTLQRLGDRIDELLELL